MLPREVLVVIFQAGTTLTTARRCNYHSSRGDSSCLTQNTVSTVYIEPGPGL